MITTLLIWLFTRLFFHSERKVVRVEEAQAYAEAHGLNRHLCLLVDYAIHSGRKRLFVWSFDEGRVVYTCPVAHGRGRDGSACRRVRFSNEVDSWLSSEGKCRVGERYTGSFGTAYRLDGLETCNSRMRERNIVLHGDRRVSTRSVFPFRTRGSRGCVVVSRRSMARLDALLAGQDGVLLYIFATPKNGQS